MQQKSKARDREFGSTMAAAATAASSSSPRARGNGGGGFLTQYFLFVLFGFGVVTLWMNSKHEGINPVQVFQNQHFSSQRFGRSSKQKRKELVGNEIPEPELMEPPVEKEQEMDRSAETGNENVPPQVVDEHQQALLLQEQQEGQGHTLAGLDCTAYGGPDNEKAEEMVYWSDIPSDNAHVSPFYDEQKFMTFEPDQGGWNNIRMSMESVLAMAVAMGRTLVLPPVQGMYLLDTGKHRHHKEEQKKHFSFNDFYHLESIANEHGGLNIITMDQFLEQEALAGKLKDSTGKIMFPPENRTDWNGRDRRQLGELKKYLRSVSHWPQWDPEDCMAAFPSSKDPKDLQKLVDLKNKIETWPKKYKLDNSFELFVGKPTPVNASAEERAKENWAQRKTLCLYDDDMQQAPLVHFGYDYNGAGARLLVHFYAFLFFENWKQDLWMKRFVRDHVRYVDEIQCAAARVVNAVRERALQRDPTSNGEYDAFHIRRGDFQYTVTRFDADKIYNVSKDALTTNATVYIGTDERDKSFFQPLANHYDIVFLDDFMHLVKDVNSNFYGMLDQLIASRSRVFFGCWFSTFTGHINRIRGYHSVKNKAPGHEDGTLPSTYYYALEDRKLHMHEFYPVKKSFYAREFPTAWRGIDASIGEMAVL
jgi:hypothetical protein